MNTSKQNLILIQMGSDPRIPLSSLGYVDDLGRSEVAETVQQDRLRQLARYVPDLVEEFSRA